MSSNFQGEGCNFFLKKMSFVRVATKILFHYNPLLNLHKIHPFRINCFWDTFMRSMTLNIMTKIIEESTLVRLFSSDSNESP